MIDQLDICDLLPFQPRPASDLMFYLGTHQPAWLWDNTIPADVAMFVSHGRLDGGPKGPRVSQYPAAVRDWALDSRLKWEPMAGCEGKGHLTSSPRLKPGDSHD